MNKEEFLEKFQDVLQRDEPVSMDMELKDIEEWDSLAALSACAFLNAECGVQITFNDLKEMKTVSDVAKKAGV